MIIHGPAFLPSVQSYVARAALVPSVARGKGNQGVIEASRQYLRTVPLPAFGTTSCAGFAAALDQTTSDLQSNMPQAGRHWGIARKTLNVFLRDCLYNTYLRHANRLAAAEGFFELPLDSITVRHLREAAGKGRLPSWPGVKHLTPATSQAYQAFAADVAAAHKVERVHLDALWWSLARDSAAT